MVKCCCGFLLLDQYAGDGKMLYVPGLWFSLGFSATSHTFDYSAVEEGFAFKYIGTNAPGQEWNAIKMIQAGEKKNNVPFRETAHLQTLT